MRFELSQLHRHSPCRGRPPHNSRPRLCVVNRSQGITHIVATLLKRLLQACLRSSLRSLPQCRDRGWQWKLSPSAITTDHMHTPLYNKTRPRTRHRRPLIDMLLRLHKHTSRSLATRLNTAPRHNRTQPHRLLSMPATELPEDGTMDLLLRRTFVTRAGLLISSLLATAGNKAPGLRRHRARHHRSRGLQLRNRSTPPINTQLEMSGRTARSPCRVATHRRQQHRGLLTQARPTTATRRRPCHVIRERCPAGATLQSVMTTEGRHLLPRVQGGIRSRTRETQEIHEIQETRGI